MNLGLSLDASCNTFDVYQLLELSSLAGVSDFRAVFYCFWGVW